MLFNPYKHLASLAEMLGHCSLSACGDKAVNLNQFCLMSALWQLSHCLSSTRGDYLCRGVSRYVWRCSNRLNFYTFLSYFTFTLGDLYEIRRGRIYISQMDGVYVELNLKKWTNISGNSQGTSVVMCKMSPKTEFLSFHDATCCWKVRLSKFHPYTAPGVMIFSISMIYVKVTFALN